MTYGSDQDKVSTVLLIPELARIRVRSQEQEDEIIAAGGQIQVHDLWTTEALIDRLKSCILQVKEEKSQSPRSSLQFRYDRKYLNYTVELIENWTKIEEANQSHEFVFILSDLLGSDGRLVAELIDLANITPSTIDDVFHRLLEWLFGMVGAGWFYQSAAEEIQVRFEP